LLVGGTYESYVQHAVTEVCPNSRGMLPGKILKIQFKMEQESEKMENSNLYMKGMYPYPSL